MCRLILAIAVLAAVAGCSDNDNDNNSPRSMRERQDQALRDPFNYSPGVKEATSGSDGTLDFDHRAFKRDVHNVLDP